MEHHHHHHQQQPNTSESVPTLPTEIIVQILLKLPVESLLRCKSVCKSWCSLISDPQFIKSHLAISTRNNYYRQHRLVFSTGQGEKLKTFNLHDVLYDNNSSINNALELDYPFRQPLKTPKIVGSCNGLVCVAIPGVAPYIWNPSTRKSNRLPPTGYRKQFGWYVLYGFGYDESTDDYKVVEISSHDKGGTKCETYVKIYSLKNGSGSWKKIGAFPHGLRFHMNYGKFCNGALHWAASKYLGPWTIVSLDLANETYGQVLQPVYDAANKYLTLGTLREQLCVLCEYPGVRADLWVMKVYGLKDSWTKLVSIPYLTDPGMERFFMPLCILNDGNILLQFGHLGQSKLVVYDSKNGSFSENRNFNICHHASTFVESLVSPMPPQAAAGLGDR